MQSAKVNQAKIHTFFHTFSRVIIIFPIIIIALGIILKIDQQKTLSQTSRFPAFTSTALTPTPLRRTTPTPTTILFNLKGPLVCTFTDKKDISGTSFIKNKNIFANVDNLEKNSKTSVLVKGDCIYVWEKDSSKGQKTCGIKQYLMLLDMFANLNILDMEMIMGMVTQYASDNNIDTEVPSDPPIPICEKNPVEDKLFDIPKNVQFTVKPLITGAPKQ